MQSGELLDLLQKNDKNTKREVFELCYGKLAAIAQRYSKNQTQSETILNGGFAFCYTKLIQQKNNKSIQLESFLEKEFIHFAVESIKSIRSEYYVSSTVYAIDTSPKNYDLFQNNELIDFNQVENDILIKSLQQLVPSQRLIFNLHVIDGFSVNEAAIFLEFSEETIKSNLEKARFNLQKNLEKCLRGIKV